jgi:hypothetical protein
MKEKVLAVEEIRLAFTSASRGMTAKEIVHATWRAWEMKSDTALPKSLNHISHI